MRRNLVPTYNLETSLFIKGAFNCSSDSEEIGYIFLVFFATI